MSANNEIKSKIGKASEEAQVDVDDMVKGGFGQILEKKEETSGME